MGGRHVSCKVILSLCYCALYGIIDGGVAIHNWVGVLLFPANWVVSSRYLLCKDSLRLLDPCVVKMYLLNGRRMDVLVCSKTSLEWLGIHDMRTCRLQKVGEDSNCTI